MLGILPRGLASRAAEMLALCRVVTDQWRLKPESRALSPARQIFSSRSPAFSQNSDILISRTLRRHQFIEQPQFSPRELDLGSIDLRAQMSERLVGGCVGEGMEANGQGLGLLIGNEIDLSAVDGAQQTARVVMSAHLLADDLRHCCLCAIGDHFDGVDEVLALRAQAIEACVFGEIFIRNVPLRDLALSLELIDFFS